MFWWQPESEADATAGGEGTSAGALKRGASVDSAQDVKRFRTATSAVGTVRKS